MKKIVFFILILVLMVSSCNLFVNEKYGELILSFDGALPDGARALDSNGLPVLLSAEMKIKIVKGDGSIIKKELIADERKSLVEFVPVGEKIEISVTAYNPSAQWSGKKTHTVTSGQNRVTVLLNKKASGLNKMLFTQKMIKHSGHNEYRLNLYLEGKEIKLIQSQDSYVFARDSKGRVYIRCNSAFPEIRRYTSEGKNDKDPVQTGAYFLANDYTKGKIYAANSYSLMEISEHLTGINGKPISDSGIFAVDNDRIACCPDWHDHKLWFSKIDINQVNEIDGDKIERLAKRYGIEDEWNVNDLFIRGDYIYILLSTLNENSSSDEPNIYSLGAVLKWKLGEKKILSSTVQPVVLPDLVEEPVLIGKTSGEPSFKNGVIPSSYYSSNFYGAVKVIGFDDENIYIADDGFDADYIDGSPRIAKNRNRIGVLNIETNSLTFTDAAPAKWYNEWKEWDAPNTKTIVWDKEHDSDGNFKKTIVKIHGSSGKLFETESNPKGLFAFDQSGSLYIPYTDGHDNKIRRFVQDDVGEYSDEDFKFPTDSPPPFAFPEAIAVDTSRSHKFHAQYLTYTPQEAYYNVFYAADYDSVKRLVWKDDFKDAFNDSSYNVQESGWRVTALAANKDGLFVAFLKQDVMKYGIKINHYDKVSKALLGTVTVVPEGTPGKDGDFEIIEGISAMHIQDGVLYALTARQMEKSDVVPKRIFTSGKLWYISNTADFVENNKRILFSSGESTSEPDTVEKNFTPWRFIAVKPKKLVIASDGVYGTHDVSGPVTTENFDKIFTFEISSWQNPDVEKLENTTFTNVIVTSASYEFLP